MAMFYVQGTLSHPGDPKLQRRLRFLVDSGAFFTVVPHEVLSALKIRPVRKETVQFADGRRARWKVGEARLEADGRSVTTLVLFGKKGTQALLGAYSLEGLGLSVDSRHRRLFPMPIVIVADSTRFRLLQAAAQDVRWISPPLCLNSSAFSRSHYAIAAMRGRPLASRRQRVRRLPDFRRGTWAWSQRAASGVARQASPSSASQITASSRLPGA